MTPEELAALIDSLSEGYDPENPTTIVDAVNEIDAAQLSEVRDELAEIIVEHNRAIQSGEGTRDDLESMTEARAILDAVDNRIGGIEEENEEMRTTAAQIAEQTVPGPDPEEEDDEDDDDEEEDPPAPEGEGEEDDDEEEAEEVTASGRRLPRPGALRRHRRPAHEPAPSETVTALVAAGDVDGTQPGQIYSDRLELARAMQRMARATAGGKDGRDYVVARMEYSHGRTLTADAQANYDVLREIEREFNRDPDLDPLVAAGGFCAPETPLYSFFDISGETGLLVLPALDAPRGKVAIPDSPSLNDIFENADWDAAVGVEWTEDDDIAVDFDDDTTWKNCFFVPCGDSSSFQVKAAYTCLEYGNFVQKFWPEMVSDLSGKSLKAHSHKVNAQQIGDVLALATAGTTKTAIDLDDAGGIIQLLHNLEFFAAEYRDKFRMDTTAPIDVLLPHWVRNAVYNDYVARQGVTDFEKVLTWFDEVLRARALRPQFLMDWQDLIDEGDYPLTVDVAMYAPGTVVRLNEGTLDFGITRDTQSNRKNTFQQFLETFQGVAKVGHEVRVVNNIQIYPNGETGEQTTIPLPTS